MEKKEIVVATGGRGIFPNSKLIKELNEEAVKVWTPKDEEDLSVYSDDVLTLEEAIEAVAKEEGLTVEEVKAHVHKFQRDLYKKYTKKKVDKVKAKSKKKQIKKSKKKNR
ncbi:hypothetical protein PQE68_gp148 [Bacillus phage vB_BanS_Sophrita]|uniref:Uncharacterized protein n=1 Tax=Bacillus phage vB_BanS_Sophrita TaxID=2894790 RepID=A0AAE9CDZ8_9CAUD|nr:hypothetical protein PQE68_gp148 [Bacillus phage vB_BanS_Sophrita]UGO50739.1 hypothetical protein SOPHRITA_148 [Bacillus phage vB_BanS_Sophrita]